jgi:hypothetical protein
MRVSWLERLASVRGLWVMVLIFGVMMGGLYAGVFPPSGARAARPSAHRSSRSLAGG